MSAGIMPRRAVKLCTVFRRILAARWKTTPISLPIVQMMIDVTVEMLRSVKPRPCADEYSA